MTDLTDEAKEQIATLAAADPDFAAGLPLEYAEFVPLEVRPIVGTKGRVPHTAFVIHPAVADLSDEVKAEIVAAAEDESVFPEGHPYEGQVAGEVFVRGLPPEYAEVLDPKHHRLLSTRYFRP